MSICEGDNKIIAEMIDLFSTQIKEMSVELKLAESACDYETLSNLAHKAKSTVAIMGMKNLAERLKDLEIMAKNGIDKESYKKQIDFFIEESETGIKELNEFKNTLKIC